MNFRKSRKTPVGKHLRHFQMNDERQKLAERLAEETGLAIVLADGNGTEVCLANNNSICEAMMASDVFSRRCANDCGKAPGVALANGTPFTFECHAGLACTAVALDSPRPLVAIIGRAFTKSESYYAAAQRSLSGDWIGFNPEKLFANVLVTGSSAGFDKAVKGISKPSSPARNDAAAPVPSSGPESIPIEPIVVTAADIIPHEDDSVPVEPVVASAVASVPKEEEKEDIIPLAPFTSEVVLEEPEEIEAPTEPTVNPGAEHRIEQDRVAVEGRRESAERKAVEEEAVVWKSLLLSLLDRPYREAFASIVRFLHEQYGLRSIAWLERHGAQFETILSDGALGGRQFRVALRSNDDRLTGALRDETCLELRSTTQSGDIMTVSLFPIAVGGEIRSAVAVADSFDSDVSMRRIARFCRTVASEIEILRLRDEVHRRSLLANAVERFNMSLDKIDSEAFWADMLNISAELMQAERGSLMVFDEKTGECEIVAVVGANPSKLKSDRKSIGKRVAQAVLKKGIPVVVGDAKKAGLAPPPSERNYKSGSFISYPFRIGEGKVGLLNVTDKVDGGVYNNLDLDLLNAVAPQFSVLIDRATLISKAGEYQQLSVTDPLTGLLNRRYLRERLAEEVRRSNRSGQQLSFMMIDVDEFKSYNDKFGHSEGDKALQIVARCLKDSLRGADVAVRFGGEEFSILLPQTPIAEGQVIAERIRQRVASTRFPNRPVTISIGIAGCCTKIKTPEGLIEAADKALYQAKHSGRNRVRSFDESNVAMEAEVVRRGERS